MKADIGHQLKKAAVRYAKKNLRKKKMAREGTMGNSNVFSKFGAEKQGGM